MPDHLMNLWKKYKTTVNLNFDLYNEEGDDINHWKNILFAKTIICILPLSFIALIPGLVYSWEIANYQIFVMDFLALLIVVSIGLVPGIKIGLRKTLFISIFYIVATFFLLVIGITGPGLIYLLSATFFCVMIFPNKYSYHPTIANLVICLLILALIPFSVLPWSERSYHNFNAWIATASNLIFLSFVTSMIIPLVFNGLKKAIQKEKKSKLELDEKNLELLKTMEELKSKNTDLEVFAYSASHDLQEPLRMITGFLAQLEKNYNDKLDERGKKYIYFAVDGAQRMRKIIQDVLEYSRIGKKEEEKEPVDVHVIVDEICELNKRCIKEKSALILKKNLPSIHSFKTPLLQVFQNLIGNALKYSRSDVKPEIWISAEEAPTRWIFSVKDNGIGINPEYHDRIFILFQRLHSKGEYEGTGMGLAIVKKIVDKLGGEIWLDSVEGHGTTFYFTVPKQFEEEYLLN
ncbi:ATP-binding protein [Aquiflexum sp.]|uniref:sensor histidine kinase n=1 Tax=Aquiflexum sp. TaxID=1872584 RepID=UPI0035944490